ncbi:hypothetical protein [Bradyrhizobium sp.]|jgi:hypothetical protein|uniref:hypothetical protein n=1 Tax=Bradyrhizobium sp. TaxID=376 RepID=UPI002DDCAF93|nr:hypothetical protein [Bradyrhizobium sp.]HEV2155456.1 hypothetical protein [Bradyrhizobium sp.]
MQPLPTRQQRFDRKWIPEPNCGCHIWIGGLNEHGYGVFWNGERLEKAHRFALKAAGVEVPDSADVLHRCDFPPCVNPDHLFVGDAFANVDDMWAKRRATVLRRRGTAQAHAKLTDEKAAEIRRAYTAFEANQYELAAIYGVSQRTIWNVINTRNWIAPSGVIVERGRGKCA